MRKEMAGERKGREGGHCERFQEHLHLTRVL
jgi:hypothetical protein